MRKLLAVIFALPVSFYLYAQSDEETRRIWPEEYVKAKPAAASSDAGVAHQKRKKPAYKVATPSTPKVVIEKVAEETVVGVTIWRLRPAKNASEGLTLGNENLVPERVEGSTVLSKGDRIRLSIEAARDGYLYVINREQYSDGTYGDPYLIYPTSRIAGGDHRTSIGRVLEIPAQTDQPPYFTLSPGNPNQVAEVISVLITPQPLSNLKISDKPVQLSSMQVKEWENQWGNNVGRLEMENGAGQAWTSAEKDAGVGTRLLKHDDPPPQSIYFNPETKAGDPAFINVNLRYQESD